MSFTAWTWLLCGGLYATFFAWYTSFGGPLTDAEVEHYVSLFEAREPPLPAATIAQLRRFMEQDSGDDFVMLNAIDMYDAPLQVDGVTAQDSSDDVLAKYMQYMYPALFVRACHPVMVGEAAGAALDLMNAPGMADWTRGAAMRYRSRRDMLEIATNPDFAGSHQFKVAAMQKTIAYPLDPWFQLGDPRILLGLLLALVASLLSWWRATSSD